MHALPHLLVGGVLFFSFFALNYAAYKIRLPVIAAFIAFGMIVGSNLTEFQAEMNFLGEVGIVLLFFLLGLEFPLKRLLQISAKVMPAGLLDLVLNMGGAILISSLFGLGWLESLLLGAVAYASSSSITIKLLEDHKRLASQEAEFILALLIFEDLVAPIIVSVVASLWVGTAVSTPAICLLIFKTLLFVAGAAFLGHVAFRKLGRFIEIYYEEDFMPLFAAGIAFAYAGLAMFFGLSSVLGAFLAGIMLSEAGHTSELDTIMLPVRNLFLPFFFFWFGTTIVIEGTFISFWLLLVYVVWSIFGKILTGYYGGRIYGLKKASALRAGFSLAQRGEFSVFVAATATPGLRAFSGLYILLSTFIGMFMFQFAGHWARFITKTSSVKKDLQKPADYS